MKDARAYHRLKKRYRLASILIQLGFLGAFSFFAAEPLSAWAGDRTLFIALFFVLWQLVLWPLKLLSGWRLEKDFGLLKQGFKGWLADQAKSFSLSFAFFLAAALVFYAAAENFPAQAWWALALLSFSFSTFFAAVFPVWILPLFFKTAPFEDAALKERLEKTLARCGYPGLPLFIIRLGEKTVRENAMLAGMGRTRRALVSDTLLAHYTDAETEMVLAHEAGHHARRHLPRSLALEAAMALAGFWALFNFFGIDQLTDTAFFPVLALLSYAAGLLSLPLVNGFSRTHEREADRFALRQYPDIAVFRSLMEKLAARNLADPAPGRLEELIFYTHPSKARRIAHAERFTSGLLANQAQPV